MLINLFIISQAKRNCRAKSMSSMLTCKHLFYMHIIRVRAWCSINFCTDNYGLFFSLLASRQTIIWLRAGFFIDYAQFAYLQIVKPLNVFWFCCCVCIVLLSLTKLTIRLHWNINFYGVVCAREQKSLSDCIVFATSKVTSQLLRILPSALNDRAYSCTASA